MKYYSGFRPSGVPIEDRCDGANRSGLIGRIAESADLLRNRVAQCLSGLTSNLVTARQLVGTQIPITEQLKLIGLIYYNTVHVAESPSGDGREQLGELLSCCDTASDLSFQLTEIPPLVAGIRWRDTASEPPCFTASADVDEGFLLDVEEFIDQVHEDLVDFFGLPSCPACGGAQLDPTGADPQPAGRE